MFEFKDYDKLMEKIKELTAPYGENAIETDGMVTGRFEHKEAEYLYGIEVYNGRAAVEISLPFGIDGYRKVNFIDEVMDEVDTAIAYIKQLENRLNSSLSLASRKKILSQIADLSVAYIVNNMYWDAVENDFEDMGIDFGMPYTTISFDFFFDYGTFDDEEFAQRFQLFTEMAKKTLDYYIAFSSESYAD